MKLQTASTTTHQHLQNIKRTEKNLARLCVGLGICVAVALAPWNISFISNFLYYWLPHLLLLGLLLLLGARYASIAGSAIVLAGFLAFYGAYVSYRNDTSGLAWLGYLLSMPGAALGAFVGMVLTKKYVKIFAALCVAASLTAIGIGANVAVLCNTAVAC